MVSLWGLLWGHITLLATYMLRKGLYIWTLSCKWQKYLWSSLCHLLGFSVVLLNKSMLVGACSNVEILEICFVLNDNVVCNELWLSSIWKCSNWDHWNSLKVKSRWEMESASEPFGLSGSILFHQYSLDGLWTMTS
jgi:hypothetical protein